MGIISKEEAGSGGFTPVPEGSHIARCVTVVDLGVQQTPWGDKKQVYIGWEIPGFTVEWEKDGTKHSGPGLIGVTWTNNLYEDSNLGKALISWRGKPFTAAEKKAFDLTNLLGVPCMLSVVHNESKNGKTYANVASVMGLPAGVTAPEQVTPSVAYSPADSTLVGNLELLPNWLQEKASAGMSEMAPSSKPPSAPPEDYDYSDIPF